MAPPPPATMPLQQRFLQLAQSLQFAWFGGHLTLLFCTLRYGLSWLTFNYYSRMARFSYRMGFVAAAVTYGIVVYKAYRARVRAGKQGGALSMIADENVQYLIMALLWLYNNVQIPLALLPFAVYSVFHVLTYTRTNLLPVLQPQPAAADGKPSQSAISNTIGRFVKEYYDTSMTLVAVLEIALWFRVLGSALLWQRGSWALLVFYTAFFRARLSQSTFVQSAIQQLTARADALVQQQSTPPPARQAWETLKRVAKQAFDATDLNKYAGGAAAAQGGPKKAQ